MSSVRGGDTVEEGSFRPVQNERTAGESVRRILRGIEERRQDKTGSGVLRGGEGGGGLSGMGSPRRVASAAELSHKITIAVRCMGRAAADLYNLALKRRAPALRVPAPLCRPPAGKPRSHLALKIRTPALHAPVARRCGSLGLVLGFSAEEQLRGERGEREARVREAWSSDEGLTSVLAMGRAHCIASTSAAEPGHKTKLFTLRTGPCSGADTWHMSRPCIRWPSASCRLPGVSLNSALIWRAFSRVASRMRVSGWLTCCIDAHAADPLESYSSRGTAIFRAVLVGHETRVPQMKGKDEDVDDRSSIVFCAIEEHRCFVAAPVKSPQRRNGFEAQ
ncbi:hypothetical protein K438DRAFT_1767141 [Mycena galopus ATCC 62051]|nr:hypothetical protein K438DRAFT_1767141 [Mycena galopus ATCC 62051]